MLNHPTDQSFRPFDVRDRRGLRLQSTVEQEHLRVLLHRVRSKRPPRSLLSQERTKKEFHQKRSGRRSGYD